MSASLWRYYINHRKRKIKDKISKVSFKVDAFGVVVACVFLSTVVFNGMTVVVVTVVVVVVEVVVVVVEVVSGIKFDIWSICLSQSRQTGLHCSFSRRNPCSHMQPSLKS